MFRSVLAGSLLALSLAAPAVAQSDPPLDPALLGDDWSTLDVQVESFPTTEGVSAEFEYALYGGPAGARAYVGVVTYDPTPAMARTLWTALNGFFDESRADFDADYSSEDDLAERALPAGCADARRITGTDELSGNTHPVAMVICADDPGRVVLVLTSGEVAGASSITAAENVVELVTAGGSATPTP